MRISDDVELTGGKEITKRMAIGIAHPPGRLYDRE